MLNNVNNQKKFEKKINKIKNKNKNAIRKINVFDQTNFNNKGKTNETKYI
jgi:hypothetical protein